MKVSLEWLEDYVDIDLPPAELADLLSMSGTVVDRVLPVGKGVTGVVVGRIVEVRTHPSADRLLVCMVEDGSMVREIVCGAPNAREGIKVALALPGARLPEISDKELHGANIRGVVSDGMLCSGVELGVSEDSSGILELEEESTVGVDLHEVFPLEDVIFELEITPNRPDCMSVVGIAREVAALTGGNLRLPEIEVYETGGPVDELAKVVIEDTQGCPRYTARVVTDVAVAASTPWMQRRLISAGLRPINGVVDATNYVLIELGQPLHAFDLDLLAERTIVVRKARHGELITTLDGVERQLDVKTLVIADIQKPVALAGIIGGRETEVTGKTRNILIESAYFEPTSILRTSKRLGLRTEASARFERGTDPGATGYAARRAAFLINQISGGRIATGEVDIYPELISPVTIELRPSNVNRILGTEISRAEVVDILERLEVEVKDLEILEVKVPTFRRDLVREIDLIEEIARIYGYGRIPEGLPAGGGIDAGLSRRQLLEGKMVDILVAQGLLEIITQNFMRTGDLDLLLLPHDDRLRGVVALANPLAETGEVMRTTMLPGIIKVAAGNINRGNRDLALFERGRTFITKGPGELPLEVECLGIFLGGLKGSMGWGDQPGGFDFYDLKGLLENVAEALRVKNMSFEPGERPFFEPGLCAEVLIGTTAIGSIGQLRLEVAKNFGLDGEFYTCEIRLVDLIDSAGMKDEYRPVGRYPTVKVDIAIIVDGEIEEKRLEERISGQGGEFLKSVRLFDVYRGPQIPEGKKSLAYALEFSSSKRTLTDRDAHRELDRIVEDLKHTFGAALRGRNEGPGEEN